MQANDILIDDLSMQKLQLGNLNDRFDQLRADDDLTLVHYTSADTLFRIVEGRAIWMRNARFMNDFKEMDHGLDAIREFFAVDAQRKAFKDAVDAIHPDTFDELDRRMSYFQSRFVFSTYITCLSEHRFTTDFRGKLSMWRGYGGSGVSVALVLNKALLIAEGDAYGIHGFPVEYVESEVLQARIYDKIALLNANMTTYAQADRQQFLDTLFFMFQIMICATKHKGFEEEREWRLLYLPKVYPNAGMEKHRDYVSIGGLPQTIYRFPMDGNAINNGFAMSMHDVLHSVIIGPCSEPEPISDAINGLLRNKVKILKPRVSISGIPYKARV